LSLRLVVVAVLRDVLVAVTLVLLATMSSFAYASPPDPSWVHGIYDDADFDDVVGLVMQAAAVVGPADLTGLQLMPPLAAVAALLPEQSPSSLSISTLHARAPPPRQP
jgi:hypothetical protein